MRQLPPPCCLQGVGVATVTDVQLNLKGSILSVCAIVTTCLAQIWTGTSQKRSTPSPLLLGNLREDQSEKGRIGCRDMEREGGDADGLGHGRIRQPARRKWERVWKRQALEPEEDGFQGNKATFALSTQATSCGGARSIGLPGGGETMMGMYG